MNRAGWWKGLVSCIWFRGRHFSPSLPDRGPTQGWEPTGIWNLAHSISDPRTEISGILVMVRRSSAPSRGTTYWFQFFCMFSFVPPFSSTHAQFFSSANCYQKNKTKQKNRLSKRQSPTTVLLRTPITQMIIFDQSMLLSGSNHFLCLRYAVSLLIVSTQ